MCDSRLIFALLTSCGVIGCAADGPAAPAGEAAVPLAAESLDAVAIRPRALSVHVFRLSVPSGAVSANEDFWRLLDETDLAPGDADVLGRNGVRVGSAGLASLGVIRPFLEDPTAARQTVLATRAELVELELKTGLPEQTLFFFDSTADGVEAIGRTYGRSDNLVFVSFRPVPRDAGRVELALAPAVRSRRRVQEFTLRNREQEREYDATESLYELNLRVDLPFDRFLVISPGPGALTETSIGRAFFTEDRPTERVEKVLLIIPEAVEIEAAAR